MKQNKLTRRVGFKMMEDNVNREAKKWANVRKHIEMVNIFLFWSEHIPSQKHGGVYILEGFLGRCPSKKSHFKIEMSWSLKTPYFAGFLNSSSFTRNPENIQKLKQTTLCWFTIYPPLQGIQAAPLAIPPHPPAPRCVRAARGSVRQRRRRREWSWATAGPSVRHHLWILDVVRVLGGSSHLVSIVSNPHL